MRALRSLAMTGQVRPEQRIEVTFGQEPDDDPTHPDRPRRDDPGMR
jgi:hypothetical protein